MNKQTKQSDGNQRRKIGEGWAAGRLRVGTPNDEQLKAIGRITTHFAALEIMVKTCIWELIGQEQEIGRIVTEQRMSFSSLIDLLSVLHRHRVPNDPTGEKSTRLLQGLVSRLYEAEKQRNIIVHSLWLVDGISETVIRTKTTARGKTGLRDNFEALSADDLNKIADFIEDVVFEVGDFWTSLLFFPHLKDADGNFPV